MGESQILSCIILKDTQFNIIYIIRSPVCKEPCSERCDTINLSCLNL